MPGATGSNTTNVARSCSGLVEQAVAQAAAEGLILHRSKTNKTGFKGVTKNNNVDKTSYTVFKWQDVKPVARVRLNLCSFATAEEAALCYARSLL